MKRELGQAADEGQVARLSSGMRMRGAGGKYHPAAARLVMLLYGAKGRPVHWIKLLDAVAPRDLKADSLDRGDNNVRVWISDARKRLGRGAIETVNGIGYILTEEGRASVEEILGG